MSLDLYLKCPCCKKEVWASNYTYNVSPMWYAIFPNHDQMLPIEGMSGVESLTVLGRAIDALRADPEKFRKMDPSNSWGSYQTFLAWVETLFESAREYPDCIWGASR